MKTQHGCLYNAFGLLVLFIVASAVSSALGSWMALILVAYCVYACFAGLWNRRNREDHAYFSRQAALYDNTYEVSDGLHRALIPARTAADAQFKFVRRYGGLVELTYAKRHR